ncbi:MAG: type I 3-dehydroquinate dehydratase [Verrucomicrobiia bacterium]
MSAGFPFYYSSSRGSDILVATLLIVYDCATKTMPQPETQLGGLPIGDAPRVVGTVSQADTLAKLAGAGTHDCDIVEVRLDLIGADTPGWLEQAKAIEAKGVPVIVTIRLANEGGKWTQPDEVRLPLFQAALQNLSAVDIEFRSPLLKKISALATRHQKALIVSHHDFQKTPAADELRQIIRKASDCGTIVKIATLVQTDTDLAILRELLSEKWPVRICLLGMGSPANGSQAGKLGPQTRTLFPKLGSCLTYGYLDVPVAPGQVHARELMQQLRPR